MHYRRSSAGQYLRASALWISALRASALRASALRASALRASALRASALRASALRASALWISALRASALWASALRASALWTSALRASGGPNPESEATENFVRIEVRVIASKSFLNVFEKPPASHDWATEQALFLPRPFFSCGKIVEKL